MLLTEDVDRDHNLICFTPLPRAGPSQGVWYIPLKKNVMDGEVFFIIYLFKFGVEGACACQRQTGRERK